MKKTKKGWVILISFSCVFTFFVCKTIGLIPYYPPDRDCLLNNTILSIDSFPPGTTAGNFHDVDEPAFDSIGRGFHAKGGITVYYTLRHRNSTLANRKYTSEYDVYLRNEGWQVPDEIQFDSQYSDEFYYACSNTYLPPSEICQAIGQYKEYSVRLSAHIHEDGVNYEVFENLLEEIDWRMAQCLGVPTTENTP